MNIPTTIKIISDSNELVYVNEKLVLKKSIGHNYKYIKSETKEGSILFLTDNDIEDGLKKDIFIEVK